MATWNRRGRERHLADSLSAAGRSEAAVEAARDAVTAYRRLAVDDPDGTSRLSRTP